MPPRAYLCTPLYVRRQSTNSYYQINIDSPWPLVDDVMVHTHISSSSNMKSFKALWTIKFGGKVMRMDQLTPAESDRLYVTYRHVTDADAWGNSLEELNAMGLHTMDGVNAL